MTPTWPHDLEALETVSRDELARELFLRIARFPSPATLNHFLVELSESDELDSETKALFAEVACDTVFLLALDDYVHRTSIHH